MPASRPALLRSLALVILAVLFAGVAGCGKKDKSEIAVAEVGGNKIMLDYFERKMNTIPTEELPADIAVQSGREELLETMIKKEVMVLKALELGLDEDGSVSEQAERIANLTAVTNMRNDVAAKAQDVSEAEIQAYYEMLPRKLTTSYMVFDYEDQAREARALVEGGERWVDVAKRSGATNPGANDNYTMPIVYGTVADDFEREVFALPVGGISEPIETPYGFFLVRVDDITFERVQPLDTMRDKVVASVRQQKEALAVKDFVTQVFEEYELHIDDEALQIVFDAIPEDIPLEPPYPKKEDLPRLGVDSADLDKVLMSFAGKEWTIRRYADFFDDSSVFGRPRREARVGGLRRALKEIAIREMMDQVAIDRGYAKAPDVRDEYDKRREQLMVTRLNDELVRNQVSVSPEEVQAYWDEHQEEFRRAELRDVLALITESEADALSAQIDMAGGATWAEIVEKYCVPSDIRQNQGQVGKMAPTAESPLTAIAYSLEEGEMSDPVQLLDGRWAMVKVLSIEPSYLPAYDEIKVTVGARLRGEKEDARFESLIEEWMQDYEIVRYPERLMDAVYAPDPVDHSITVGLED